MELTRTQGEERIGLFVFVLIFRGSLSLDAVETTKSIGTQYRGLDVTSHSVVLQLILKRFLRFFRDVQRHIEAAF